MITLSGCGGAGWSARLVRLSCSSSGVSTYLALIIPRGCVLSMAHARVSLSWCDRGPRSRARQPRSPREGHHLSQGCQPRRAPTHVKDSSAIIPGVLPPRVWPRKGFCWIGAGGEPELGRVRRDGVARWWHNRLGGRTGERDSQGYQQQPNQTHLGYQWSSRQIGNGRQPFLPRSELGERCSRQFGPMGVSDRARTIARARGSDRGRGAAACDHQPRQVE